MLDAHDAYLESKVLAADPVELVRILYRMALESVRSARVALSMGDIEQRSLNLNRAIGALSELSTSLNHDVGGELSRTLAELYDYMQRRLIQANLEQADEPIEEVYRLLGTLLEAWESLETSRNQTLDQHPMEAFIEPQGDDSSLPRFTACV